MTRRPQLLDAAVSAAVCAVGSWTWWRREQLKWLHTKGGFRFILFAIIGCRPVKDWEQKRGPSTWAALDKEEQVCDAKDPIVVCGSSILRQWATARDDFLPSPMLNRAFGGSRTWELDAAVADKLSAYGPSVVIHYCGSNDFTWAANAFIPFDRAAAEAAENTRLFIHRLRKRCRPDLQVVCVACINAPSKRKKGASAAIALLNARVARMCADSPRQMHFVDMNPHLEDDRGAPLIQLYLEDGTHYKPEAYSRFAAVLVPLATRLRGRGQ